jgi:hypothetical protein
VNSILVRATEDFAPHISDVAGLAVVVPTDFGATWHLGINRAHAMEIIPSYEP